VSVLDRAIARQQLLRSTDARILTIDIETSPMQVWCWQLTGNDFIPPDRIIEPGRVLCFAAKWYGGKSVMFHAEWQEPGPVGMARAAWELLDQADIVVGYNHRRFDLKWLNTLFLREQWGPPSPFDTIDLLPTMRQTFRFPSNSLDHVSRTLEIGHKVEHEGFKLWKLVMAGDRAAQRRMRHYNIHDVELTEQVYDEVRPFIKSHPNVNLHRKERVSACDKCGSDDLERRGYRRLQTGAYALFRCRTCGGWSRATHAEERVHRRGA